MSPSPTLRATSTSRFSSIVYDASPSTSAGAMPASSSAIEIAWHASDSSVSGRPLPNAVCPIPTTAAFPRMFKGSPAFELRRPPLTERVDAFHAVVRLGVQLDEHRFFFEQRAPVDLERVVEQLLRPTDRLRRTLREPFGPLLGRGEQLVRRHDLVR